MFKDKISQELKAYSLFDFGNSAYSLMFGSFLLPLWFTAHVFSSNGSLYWGLLVSGSSFIAAMLAPALGRYADDARRFKTFCIATIASFSTAVVLSLSIYKPSWIVITLFAITNICFLFASGLYDSVLPTLAFPSERNRFSSFAWGFGYIGGVIAFVIGYVLYLKLSSVQIGLMAAALFYSLFASLSLKRLRTFKTKIDLHVPEASPIKLLFPQKILLIGYFALSETVNTIISFTSIYAASELHLTESHIGFLLLAVQIGAFPATWAAGHLLPRWSKNPLIVCIGIWVLILGLFGLRVGIAGLWIIAALTMFVIGSTQALMRAEYSQYFLPGRSSEFFGWYAMATEISAVFGPAVFGVIAFFGSNQYAMVSLIFPLLLSSALMVWARKRLQPVF